MSSRTSVFSSINRITRVIIYRLLKFFCSCCVRGVLSSIKKKLAVTIVKQFEKTGVALVSIISSSVKSVVIIILRIVPRA